MDVFVILIVAAVAVYVAIYRDGSNIPLLAAVALLGFVGSATAARLAQRWSGTDKPALRCPSDRWRVILPSRLQAAPKPQTLGLLLILLGTALRLGIEDAATLGLVALFQVLTAPVTSQLIGRSAYRAGSIRRDPGGGRRARSPAVPGATRPH